MKRFYGYGAVLAATLAQMPLTATAQDAVEPRIEDLSVLDIGMTFPPLPAPLNWVGGGCFSGPNEPVCARSFNVMTGTGGAYTTVTTSYAAGHTEAGDARWTLLELVALPFPTTEKTFFVGGECQGGPENTFAVLFFDSWPEDGSAPLPIWGADINVTTGMISLSADLTAYDCPVEEP